MEKLKTGTKVLHKEHDFEGVILDEHFIDGFYNLLITDGENPHFPTRKFYTARKEALTVLDAPEEAKAEEVEETTDTYAVEMELDGVLVRFDTISDFLTFLECGE